MKYSETYLKNKEGLAAARNQNKGGFVKRYLIISQTNMYYRVFQYFVSIACIFSSFMYALFASFRYDVDIDHLIDDELF